MALFDVIVGLFLLKFLLFYVTNCILLCWRVVILFADRHRQTKINKIRNMLIDWCAGFRGDGPIVEQFPDFNDSRDIWISSSEVTLKLEINAHDHYL